MNIQKDMDSNIEGTLKNTFNEKIVDSQAPFLAHAFI